MKVKARALVPVVLIVAAVIAVSCSSCGMGKPVTINRSYAQVVNILSTVGDRDKHITTNETGVVISFWKQPIMFRGLRYKIHVRERTPETAEVAALVWNDAPLVPGRNIFSRRSLNKKQIVEMIDRAEYWINYWKEREEAQQAESTVPLEAVPSASSDVR